MPPAPEALSSLATRDPAEFSGHYMRSFAHAMPWYARPQRNETPYGQEGFMRYLFERMQAVLVPGERPEFKRNNKITADRAVVRHVCFMILREGIYPRVAQYSAINAARPAAENRDIMLKSIRHDLFRIVNRKVMVMPFPQHPLYGSYKARAAESVGGVSMKVMDTNVDDRAFADWLRGKPIEDLLHAMPEITEPAEGQRIALYCSVMRRKLADATSAAPILMITSCKRAPTKSPTPGWRCPMLASWSACSPSS